MSYTPPGRPSRRRFIGWLVLALILGGAAWWWSHHKSSEKPRVPPANVVLSSTVRRDVPVYLTGLGTVQAYNTVTVRAQVDGQLMAIKFREGQNVKAGDVLAQIDPRTFQAAYDQALANKAKNEANLANAQLDLKRYRKLGDAVPRQTIDTQEATVRQLAAQIKADEAAISSAKTELSYTTITAPIGGRTGLRQVDVGNIVHSGDAGGLVVITQLQPISLMFSLPQQQLESITAQLAQQPQLAVDALGQDNKTVLDSGKLLLIDNQIDQATGTIKLKAELPNAAGQLWPGAFVNARLLLTLERNALTVPSVAVQQGPKGAFVFLYNADDTVTMQPVTVARTEGTNAVITSGLSDGDRVVTDGMAKLQDKSKVTVAPPRDEAVPTEAPIPDEAVKDEAPKKDSRPHRKHGG